MRTSFKAEKELSTGKEHCINKDQAEENLKLILTGAFSARKNLRRKEMFWEVFYLPPQ